MDLDERLRWLREQLAELNGGVDRYGEPDFDAVLWSIADRWNEELAEAGDQR